VAGVADDWYAISTPAPVLGATGQAAVVRNVVGMSTT